MVKGVPHRRSGRPRPAALGDRIALGHDELLTPLVEASTRREIAVWRVQSSRQADRPQAGLKVNDSGSCSCRICAALADTFHTQLCCLLNSIKLRLAGSSIAPQWPATSRAVERCAIYLGRKYTEARNELAVRRSSLSMRIRSSLACSATVSTSFMVKTKC